MAWLSAREAAQLLGVSPDTAERRAQAALARGDTRIQRGRKQFIAEEAVWRELIPGPVSRGRPPSNEKR